MQSNTGRVRAWLLVKAMEPELAQRALSPLTRRRNGLIPNDDDVVIRVDIVDCDFNLIVPVDVTGEQSLRMVVGLVFQAEGVKSVTVAKVRAYSPEPGRRSRLLHR